MRPPHYAFCVGGRGGGGGGGDGGGGDRGRGCGILSSRMIFSL